MRKEILKLKMELDHMHADLKLHKMKIIKREEMHQPGRKLIQGLEELHDCMKECDCSICCIAEKIHLRLENKKSCFMFLTEHIDHQMWSALKRFVECTINENFEPPEPKRKKAEHTADKRCEEDEMTKDVMMTVENDETDRLQGLQ